MKMKLNHRVFYLLGLATELLEEADYDSKKIIYPDHLNIVEKAAIKTCLETIKTIVEVGLETEILKDE